MPAPLFSVVIPTYNRATLVTTAIQSVLDQTDGDFELLIVDDGSTDETGSVVAQQLDPRIRYEPRPHRGVSPTRNSGAEAATGTFLVFLDSDDELLPDALERYRAAIKSNGWDIVVATRIAVSPDRREWRTIIPRRLGFLPGGFAVRRTLFVDAGGYDAALRYGENTELGWRLRQHAQQHGSTIGVVEQPVVVRYDRAARSYDEAKYEAAVRILDAHDDTLSSDVAGSRAPRRRRASYQAIAGVHAARIGRRRDALRYTLAAVANDPLRPVRYRNLLTALGAARRRPTRDAPAREVPKHPLPDGAIHGVLVTFGRPESLTAMIAELAQTDLATLTVVDNAPSETSRAAAHSRAGVLPTTYVAMNENTGPAGGLAAGMTRVLETAADNDWVITLDDDRLTGSIETPGELRDFGIWLTQKGAPVGAVGQVGSRFDRGRGRLRRLHDDELAGPVSVDYVAGGQLLMLRVAAMRSTGVFDPELFFGFDDLDYCLRLARNGYGIYVYGPAAIEARRRFGRLGEVGSAPRRLSVWRRYYAVRNHIVIMRRHVSTSRAIGVTLALVAGRPVADLARGSGFETIAVARAGTRGALDAWRNRLGRTVDPPPGA